MSFLEYIELKKSVLRVSQKEDLFTLYFKNQLWNEGKSFHFYLANFCKSLDKFQIYRSCP